MAAPTNRFFALLLSVLRARSRIVSLASRARRAKAGPPPAAGEQTSRLSDRCSLPTVVSVPVQTAAPAVSSPRELQPAPPQAQLPAATYSLPFELLCGCLTDFALHELLPVRLVSKVWLAAVNAQDAFSRTIDYTARAFSKESELDGAFALLVTRITCTLRLICLDINLSLRDRNADAICSTISEHLERIESLSVSFTSVTTASLVAALQRPAPRLRALSLQYWPDGDTYSRELPRDAARIPPDVFAGQAPLLQWLSLVNCGVDPSAPYPALQHAKQLTLRLQAQECSGPLRMLALCPQVEVMSIDTRLSLEQLNDRLPPPGVVEFPCLAVVRLAAHGVDAQDQVDMLNALTTPTTYQVSLPIPRRELFDTMLAQMSGLGPFAFVVDTWPGQSSYCAGTKNHMMYIKLISLSAQRVRVVEVHEVEHWEWEGNEEGLLESFEDSELAHDILTVHIVLRPGALYTPFALLGDISGTWPSVRTIRIDMLGGKPSVPVRLQSAFPALTHVVFFHPFLPPNYPWERLAEFCSKFLPFFNHSRTDVRTIVVTRDSRTADVVAAYPSAAYNNPLCVVFPWRVYEL